MFAKLALATVIAAGASMTFAGPSSAMTIVTTAPAYAVPIETVRWGCGPGWHPNRWGRCVPNRRVYYGWAPPVYVYHYGWHRPVYYGWHRHYWHRRHHWR